MAKKKRVAHTVDERLEFLLQSTESLHSSMQELHSLQANTERRIDRFVAVAQRIIERYDRRITKLEGRR